jgi:hypothetical protein
MSEIHTEKSKNFRNCSMEEKSKGNTKEPISGCPVQHGNTLEHGSLEEYHKIRMSSPSLEEPKSNNFGPGNDTSSSNVIRCSSEHSITISPKEGFSTKAVQSNIPKGGSNETWTYPSEQRFYNAMKKKGWDPAPTDIPYVHAIHNAVNEMTWKKVMEYEKLHERFDFGSLISHHYPVVNANHQS